MAAAAQTRQWRDRFFGIVDSVVAITSPSNPPIDDVEDEQRPYDDPPGLVGRSSVLL